MDSPMPYPKRYKVRPRVYFIVIKTTATTLAEFKVNGGRTQSLAESSEKEPAARFSINDRPGWYEGGNPFQTCGSHSRHHEVPV